MALTGKGQLTQEAIAIWYEYLSKELNDEEWEKVVKDAMITCRFMPVPIEMVEKINSGKEVKARMDWQYIRKAAASDNPMEKLVYLSGRAKTALYCIGGISAVAQAESYQLTQLEKTFVAVYTQSTDKDVKALPPVSMSKAEKKISAEEFVPPPPHVKAQLETWIKEYGSPEQRRKHHLHVVKDNGTANT
ncbi:MAG TPA: hypothetical protein VK184_22970 [Nostocaceae cyanobacterium]|nr:hypothetical protein [Nostocaceae cyanobacterium]